MKIATVDDLLAKLGVRRSFACLSSQLGHVGLWLVALHDRKRVPQ